jgi:hypothetical protein
MELYAPAHKRVKLREARMENCGWATETDFLFATPALAYEHEFMFAGE